MANIVAALILLAVVGFAAGYVIYSRKKGRKCIGCPDGGCCGKMKTPPAAEAAVRAAAAAAEITESGDIHQSIRSMA